VFAAGRAAIERQQFLGVAQATPPPPPYHLLLAEAKTELYLCRKVLPQAGQCASNATKDA
jgi:hypothetical protein